MVISNIVVGIIVCIVGLVFSVIGFLISRTLNKVDENQRGLAENLKSLWGHHDALSKDFYLMQGQHMINHGAHLHMRKDDEK